MMDMAMEAAVWAWSLDWLTTDWTSSTWSGNQELDWLIMDKIPTTWGGNQEVIWYSRLWILCPLPGYGNQELEWLTMHLESTVSF